MKRSLLFCLFLLAPGSCSDPASIEDSSPWLAELSRLSFLPPDDGPALLADRYEVTNGEFEEFLKETAYRAEGAGFLYHWAVEAGKIFPPPGLEHHPVVFVSKKDAEAFARWKGKRLPSTSEWERLSCGGADPNVITGFSRVQYPWGGAWVPLFSNTAELGLGHTTPVGTFESGKSIFGCYDVAGNVWEWVRVKVRVKEEEEEKEDPSVGRAKGGAFDFGKVKAQCYENLDLDPEQRAIDLGFRCVVEFEGFLQRKLSGVHPSAEERKGLIQIAFSWGPAVEPFLARLEKAPGIDSSLVRDMILAAKGR